MVIIGHAAQDENGGIAGSIVGDQTGKEIVTREWYKRKNGWGVYLRPLDLEAAERAASFVEKVCANNSYGYSQPNRSSGYKSIVSHGGDIGSGEGDFDCSSLCFAAYRFAGLPVGSGSTHNLESQFLATGKFKAHREPEYLNSGSLSQRGGLYLSAGAHVAMVLSNTDEAMPDGDNDEQPTGETEEVTPPFVITYGRVRVRSGPGTAYSKLYTSVNEVLPYIETDAKTGWHKVESEMGIGWVSGKKNLTRVVLA